MGDIEQSLKQLKSDGEHGERSKSLMDGPGDKSSAASGDSMLIYNGLLQQPNRFILNHRNKYHFNKDVSQDLVPGSCHDSPWNYLLCYVSPREASMLYTQVTEVRAVRASCVVSNFGVRLSFEKIVLLTLQLMP